MKIIPNSYNNVRFKVGLHSSTIYLIKGKDNNGLWKVHWPDIFGEREDLDRNCSYSNDVISKHFQNGEWVRI